MLRVLSCIGLEHDLWLVGLAGLICVSACALGLHLLKRLSSLAGLRRLAWLTVVSGITGMGIWATHFVAMLAYRPQLHTGYELGTTVVSLVAAMILIGIGFEVYLRTHGKLWAGVAGAMFGLAVCAMHYLGMEAFKVEGVVMWDAGLIVASMIIGVAFASAAMVAERVAPGRSVRIVPTALLTVAICGLHFTGMAAVSIRPDPTISLPASSMPDHWLALWVGSGALLLLLLSLGALAFEKAAREAERHRLRQLADAAADGLMICRDNRIMITNKSFDALIGQVSGAVDGGPLADLFEEAVDCADIPAGGFMAHLRSLEGERIPVELSTQPIIYGGVAHVGVSVRDLRDRVAAEAHIRFLAHHDPLTRLANRLQFNERMEQEILRRRRTGEPFAVLCLDLDRFKQVNDVFGHAAGDAVLRVSSQRIASVLSEDDILARLGGDEFAIIRTDACQTADLANLCEEILAAVQPAVLVDGQAANVGVSIGVASFPQDGDSSIALMRNADAALYQAKKDGRGTHRFFSAAIGAEMRERERIEVDLRHALARGELKVVYQPQTDLQTGEVFGFEALVRWKSPTRGNVPPDIFVPVAEESGLIHSIGEWVLREACRTAAGWSKPLLVAVNLSGVQLRSPRLSSLVHQVLIETGLPACRLELEVTETALIADFHLALNSLRRLKALGVSIAMDDFGTGYSSLSNLRAFPFDKIKIDRSFITNVHRNEQAAAIVRAIVGLGKGMSLKVLAEGVETAEELEFLTNELCIEAQGYYFGRPGDMTEFADLMGGDPQSSTPALSEPAAPRVGKSAA